MLPIQCQQKKAGKCVPSEKDFIAANILGFGDDIGSVTNRITAQTELQSLFEPGSPEYEELRYRITAGQHVQQNCIDKTKGIVSKPMPKHWYNERAAAESGDPVDVSICASKKPYFMIYRYPELRSRYFAYLRNAEFKCRTELGEELSDLFHKSQCSETEAQFLEWFDRMCPVQYGRGVMNRICQMCEHYFAGQNHEDGGGEFDSGILKTGVDYSRCSRDRVEALYRDYMADLQALGVAADSDEELTMKRQLLKEEYRQLCALACTNEDELCDILVDICYARERSKQFAWDMAGSLMIRNLLRRSGGYFSYPRANKRGAIVYCGKRFSLETCQLEGWNERYCFG